MTKTINDFVITLEDSLYNSLNRASREYDAAITDCYYFIINGGTITDPMFERLVKEAVDSHYAYSELKDKVSNEVVIPAVARAAEVDPETSYIYDTWNIPFDGSHKCTVSNIAVTENISDTVVYTCDCPDEYVENVAKLKVRIDIINQVISKLNSITLQEFAEKSLKALKEKRIELTQEDTNNTTAFMNDFVSHKVEETGKNPDNLIWTINVVTKTFTLTEKGANTNITCSHCASSN